MKRSKGILCGKTRNLARGIKRITVNEHFKKFGEGDKVLIKIKPKNKLTFPHPKFNGRAGVVIGKKGNAYVVKVKDGKKTKLVDVLPVHLERL